VNTKLTMVYWRSKKFWVGKLLEHPEIMTQGRTLNELEDNIQDAYRGAPAIISSGLGSLGKGA
jgi:predicted RNase H-like HicB family nuclease